LGAANVNDGRARLARNFRRQGKGATVLMSPLYAGLCERLAQDVEADGPTWELLQPHAHAGLDEAYALRLLGGAHRLALAGDAPGYARHLPSTGGDGDIDAAWRALRALVADAPAPLRDALRRPPQTNEVGRAASLIGGFLVVADETRLPVRALEIGTSAGLNQRFDQYRYEQDDAGFGPSDSRLRFEGLWAKGQPPFDAPLTVAWRRGCDVDPIDVSTEDGRLTLLSYVWPDQLERFERMEAALEIAERVPAPIDRADALTWLTAQLAEPVPGVATVVFHSVMWQYMSGAAHDAITDLLGDVGGRATPDAPLAWLWLEPEGGMAYPRLRLRTWPDGRNRHLADCSFHLGPVDWKG
jgi:hypothetical protein